MRTGRIDYSGKKFLAICLSLTVSTLGCGRSDEKKPSVGINQTPESLQDYANPRKSNQDTSQGITSSNDHLEIEPEIAAQVGDTSGADSDELGIDDLILSAENLDPHSPFAHRLKRDETVWKNEVLAQEYEQSLVRLWDKLLAQDRRPDGDKYDVLASIDFDTISFGKMESVEEIDHGITITHYREKIGQAPHADWVRLIDDYRMTGLRLVQSEWHHSAFDPPSESSPARSVVHMVLYLARSTPPGRLVVDGKLRITWRESNDDDGFPVPRTIDASDLKVLERDGEPIFREVLTVNHTSKSNRSGVQPVLVYDLNNDGLSEICLGGSNELYWNRGDFAFDRDSLCKYAERIFETGLIADMNGDSHADLVVPGVRGDLLLYAGHGDGNFSNQPIGKAKTGGPLQQPQVITAGDVDNDGDLDLWIAQYKISYVGGQMPSPYYDANDGFPAYLLINDGNGRFSPATEEAGLAEKRFRRTYGSSFVDLDEDNDLDLLVVSDFSGVDVYENDGSGYFTDITDKVLDERHLFGMAATFADFNLDGQLDFFVSGMASTTARRLEYMRLGRNDRPEVHMMRSRMGYGNRMYLASNNGYTEPEFKDQVARTGWTWGATSFDFDNDGDRDIFVANGHSSGNSTKDHCTHFWCHDIYDGTSQPDFSLDSVFKDVMRGYYDRTESWDGYQKNVLLMNDKGKRFSSIAFLTGLGQQFDGRAVVSDDLDADGRVDLVVVEDRWHDGQILHVYRNELETDSHWIGFRLREQGNGFSPVGVQVKLFTDAGIQVAAIVTGDSIHAQHATTVHFGLGDVSNVQKVEFHWPNGAVGTIRNPVINTYISVDSAAVAKDTPN